MTPMVGRDAELAELREAWSVLRARPAGRPRTVVITGAAGCGKSLLVTAAVEAFDPAPVAVLSGRARIHTPAPYDWLAAALSRHPTTDLPVPADAVAWLAQQPGPTQRYAPGALLRIAVRTVKAMVAGQPAAIVVEDLHALDPASLNLIAELAYTTGLPALLLVTSRPPEEELVARTLAQLSGAPDAIRQHLGALDPGAVAAVLERAYGAPVPAAVARAAREHTGGNPYLLTELLAACRSGGPVALRHAVLARPAAAEHTGPPDLTARELDVLSCLAAGMSNKQVARSLGISIRTVTVHVSNLLRKTRSASRTEVALWAVRHQLAGPAPVAAAAHRD